MLIVDLIPCENGAYRNINDPSLQEVPNGWVEIPSELADKALQWLPFITLETKDDIVVDVKDNQKARKAFKPDVENADDIDLAIRVKELENKVEELTLMLEEVSAQSNIVLRGNVL